MTELIRDLANLKPKHKSPVVTIGNFDGVHLGHQALLKEVKARAKALHVPSMVITFEPQPIEYFNTISLDATDKGERLNITPTPRLTRLREKYIALTKQGIDYVLILKFNKSLAELSPSQFIQTILIDHLQIEHIIVGDDFRFGYKRQGNFEFLKNAGIEKGFTVEAMPSFLMDNQRISSTLIRDALSRGDYKLAEHFLGYPYKMMGRIVHGDKLGRQLGFPTANIYLHRAVTSVQGICAVHMHGIAPQPLPGVANVGIRPTVGGTRALLEVYLLDFDGDIYGRHVSVEFLKKFRDEMRYDNLELLQQAITQDVKEAKKFFDMREK